MWSYQKKLQYPVNIKNTNPKLAQYIVAQYGGPNSGCLSLKLFPKYAFKCFSVIAALYNLFKNCPCRFVFFSIADTHILQ